MPTQVGVVSVLVASVFGVWILFGGAEAACLMLILAAAFVSMVCAKRHVSELFRFSKDEAVSFAELYKFHPAISREDSREDFREGGA